MTGWPASRASAAASRNVRSMRWLQRSTSALNSSAFVGKRRNRYACEMPAALAISIVGVPCSPRAAKTRSAATRMSSRRASAVERVRVAMSRYEYALTHSACQDDLRLLSHDYHDRDDHEHERRRLHPERQRRRAALRRRLDRLE